MKNERHVVIDEDLHDLVIMAWNDIRLRSVYCGCDLYQNAKYCGGYEGDLENIEAGEFTFGKHENGREVMWITIPYKNIQSIIDGSKRTVLAYDPE